MCKIYHHSDPLSVQLIMLLFPPTTCVSIWYRYSFNCILSFLVGRYGHYIQNLYPKIDIEVIQNGSEYYSCVLEMLVGRDDTYCLQLVEKTLWPKHAACPVLSLTGVSMLPFCLRFDLTLHQPDTRTSLSFNMVLVSEDFRRVLTAACLCFCTWNVNIRGNKPGWCETVSSRFRFT